MNSTDSAAPFVVRLSPYTRTGFAVVLAAEEALSTDFWGPKDAEGRRSGNGPRRYVSPHEMNGKPCPAIYALQSIPYLARLPRDPWAPNQPTVAQVCERITKATGIQFEVEPLQ